MNSTLRWKNRAATLLLEIVTCRKALGSSYTFVLSKDCKTCNSYCPYFSINRCLVSSKLDPFQSFDDNFADEKREGEKRRIAKDVVVMRGIHGPGHNAPPQQNIQQTNEQTVKKYVWKRMGKSFMILADFFAKIRRENLLFLPLLSI